ncbi:MAG TPA: TlyA family RNA methyltransferase [Patescibacteria group bacterium]|nr:TlyA family RNA methyltransferase [Patescibacteria group bacterium]
MKQRLDQALVTRGVVTTRSQGESWIRLGKVLVNGRAQTKPGFLVSDEASVVLTATEQYVSRAGLKLSSAAKALKLEFTDIVMLDVGSSTGGFTDYALQHGARKVIAIELGTDQLHPSLHGNPKIELHEQTDIRNVVMLRGGEPGGTPAARNAVSTVGESGSTGPRHVVLSDAPDMIVIDVSFTSVRDILPHVAKISGKQTDIIAMVKPQFEASAANLKHKGVIKNDHLRRNILKSFEDWAKQYFVVLDKADSEVAGFRGNVERFYKLRPL